MEGQETTATVSIDLEKAYDTIPREMAMATLRWMAVSETEVRKGHMKSRGVSGFRSVQSKRWQEDYSMGTHWE